MTRRREGVGCLGENSEAGSRRSYVTLDLLRERAQSTFSLEDFIFFLDLSQISPYLSEMYVFCCSNLYRQEVDIR